MNLITLENSELRLTSNLDEYSFGKTNYSSIITQKGLLFDSKTSEFSMWSFSDVKSFSTEGRNDRIVFYCGENPLSDNAKTLLDYFNSDDSEEKFRAVKVIVKLFTIAAKTELKLPSNGAGGILVDLQKDTEKVLFLPEDLYRNTVNGLSKEENLELQGGWINQTIYDLPALCFERAVIVYRLLTGRFPYANADLIERNADILDRRFLPLELCVNGIDSSLAKEVNKALKLNSNSVNIPGKKQKGKSSEDLIPTADFPEELLDAAWNLSKSQNKDDRDFQEKAENWMKLRDSKINTKRTIRRNLAKIITVAIVTVVVAGLAVNLVKTNQDQYTTTGLTSTQTIQGFFMGVNIKSITLLSNFVKGKRPEKYVDVVSQIYVIDKQRKIYDKDNGYANPANWLLYSTTALKFANSSVYGVTQLKIDGKSYPMQVKLHKKNEKIEPLTKEGNVTLDKNSKSVHKVEYFLVHSEGENNGFVVEAVTDTFTLSYLKNRWVITDIDSQSEVLPVKSSNFKTDYINQIIINEGDVQKTVKQLSFEYIWLPSEYDIKKEIDLQTYNALHPLEQEEFLLD